MSYHEKKGRAVLSLPCFYFFWMKIFGDVATSLGTTSRLQLGSSSGVMEMQGQIRLWENGNVLTYNGRDEMQPL